MFCLMEASVSTDWFHNSVSENEIQREREASHAQLIYIPDGSRTIYRSEDDYRGQGRLF
jgi:hypothetical protein